jgi:hypothetical protein
MKTHVWRDVPVTQEQIKILSHACDARWRSGETVYRQMTELRVLSVAKFFGNRIATNLSWMMDFLRSDDETHERFRDAVQICFQAIADGQVPLDGTPDATIFLQAALNFIAMKALEMSDRPCWYSMSEGLAYRLIGTQLREVYPEDVRMPFPGFFIEVPPGILTIRHDVTGQHEVRAISLCEGNPTFEEYPEPSPHEPGRRLLLIVYCEPNENSTDAGDDNVLYMNVPLYDNTQPIENLIARDKEVGGEDLAEYDARDGGKFVDQPKTYGEIRDLLRNFVVNFLLYLRSPEADIQHANAGRVTSLRKEKKGSKKHRAQIERLQKEPSWLVGSKIVLNPEMREAVRESLTKRKGRPLTFKVLVSGFWRRQWYGKKSPEHPKGTEQRLKFIEPFVRGGDLPGAVMGHEYEVKGGSK